MKRIRVTTNLVGGSSTGLRSRCARQASMTSACGMLVYREDTPMVKRVWSAGRTNICIWLMKSVESLTRLDSCDHPFQDGVNESRDLSVGPPVAEMMGRPGLLSLWILGRRYREGSLGFL